jgi:CBS domain-containing protein
MTPIREMITKDAFTLLKNTPPFSFLDDNALNNIAGEMLLGFYLKGHTIYQQNGPAAEHLGIIKSGAVRVSLRTNEGEDVLIDYAAAGDFFGWLSFICGDISRDTTVAAEDTSCYLIKKETVLALLKEKPEFSEFCLRSWLKKLVDITYKEMRDRTLLYGGGDKLLFTYYLNDLATKKVITASEDIAIKDAAEIMARNGVSSLVLLDRDGLPSGMVTDRDLRSKVVSKGRDITGRVGDIMSVTIIKSEAGDYCFEALLKMIRYNIHHLLVVDKGRLSGIITSHDLMMLQGTSPLSVAKEIEDQNTIDGLLPVSKKINKIITILIKEGARASNITRLITEINDRLLKKILEITEARLGPPPLRYCWIVYGSEGRKEQTFKTDQDNAIIFDDPQGSADTAVAYFTDLADQMKSALSKCGFPPCSADYMASNPKWRRPLHLWKAYFSDWINNPTPEAILRSLIFFDFRAIHGDFLLAERLRAFLGHEVKDKNLFLAQMTGVVTQNRPPLDFFGKFICEKKGGNKGKINIKINGLCPIIDAARLSALETKVYNTSTLERLAGLRERQGTVSEFSLELEEAFEFLMSLRLRHQFQQIQEGIEPDNFINPANLRNMEKVLLKEAFKLILSVQEKTIKKYNAWMTR